jgi:quinolinate synthase
MMDMQAAIAERIRAAKATFGARLVILGHHYQKDEILQFADYRGDSLQLARAGAASAGAEFIVFCGVHFMAETAAVLAAPGQVVLFPEPEALCPLAEKADTLLVQDAWRQLGGLMDVENEVTPVTYINSEAELKDFCGRHGGLVCTSSSARKVLEWSLARRPQVLFFPDQHLGRNTGVRLEVPMERMPLWDPRKDLGGQTAEDLRAARIILWKGWCYVHTRFLPEHVRAAREKYPGVRVWVHLECTREVVELADEAGSTADIIRLVGEAPAGTKWAIGTEGNLVNRLAGGHPEQEIHLLSPVPNNCITMNMTTLESLVRVTDGLMRGELVNPVRIPPAVAEGARIALERMLEASQ